MNMKQEIFIGLCIITLDVLIAILAIHIDDGLGRVACVILLLMQGVMLIKHAAIKFYQWLGDS